MDERLTELTVRSLVERLASSDPVPGGGSASALAGSMGAALVHMVVELTVDRPAAAGHEEALTEVRAAAEARQSELLDLAELDANAYAAVVIARRLPKESEQQRQARAVQIAAAIREAIRVPLATARAASEVLELTGRLAPIGNRNAISDVGVAALLAVTAVRGAALNVEINLPSVTADDQLRDGAASEIEGLLSGLDEREGTVRDAVAERLR
jgi:formiminotetrahydrofolate cyclodeaminase